LGHLRRLTQPDRNQTRNHLMPGTPVNPAVAVELQRQLNQELSAAHAYEALSLWCEAANFKGFARFFIKQAQEERDHAHRFMNHLLNRGVLPKLAAIAAPETVGSLLETAKRAQAMERENTIGVHAAYEAALREKDYPAQVLLQWFVNEQVEEEDWTDEMVERVQDANCAGGLSDLDRHIERYLTDEPGKA
jgi:ferritin